MVIDKQPIPEIHVIDIGQLHRPALLKMMTIVEERPRTTITSAASKVPQILAALGACVGAFSLGIGNGWTSPSLVRISGNNCLPPDCYFQTPLTNEQASWVGGLFALGAVASSLFAGYSMTRIGRKWTMYFMMIPFTLGWGLLTLTGPKKLTNPWWFYVGRFLIGFAGGAFALTAPIYTSEIAEPSIRGALGSCMQLMATMGELYVNAMGAVLEWDVVTGTALVFPIIMAVIMFLLPQSPYYLITKFEFAHARASLQWLRGKDHDIEEEFETMKETHEEQLRIGSVSVKDLFTMKVYLRPFLIMLAVMFFQQYCGMNAIMFYLGDIFVKADTGLKASVGATIIALDQVLATVVAIVVVDRFGRRLLLLLSSFFMSASILSLGVFFYLDENKLKLCSNNNDNNNSTGCALSTNPFDESRVNSLRTWLPLTSISVYVFAMAVGFGTVPWVLNAEMFPLESKEISSTLTTAFSWLCTFLVVKFEVNVEVAVRSSGAYFVYAAICALMIPFVAFFVPETKGKSPEDMKEYFSK